MRTPFLGIYSSGGNNSAMGPDSSEKSILLHGIGFSISAYKYLDDRSKEKC
jgi:hypothetical protein